MKPLSSPSRLLHAKGLRIAASICAVLVIFFLLFDWNWFRPALIKYVEEQSHRTITASHLDVDFSWKLHPTIRLRDLHIQNASWSSDRPLIAVQDIAFTFATFKMLFVEKRVISLIEMSDGEVNLEKLENGLRNWRLLDPEYKGPGKYIVMALKTNKSTIRFNDHALQLDMTATSQPIISSANSDDEPFANTIVFDGNYHEQKFKGTALAGQTLTFQRTGEVFPIKAEVNSGKTRFTVNGEIGDILLDQIIDADFHLAGDTLSSLNPFMNMQISPSHAFDAQAHLVKSSNQYSATNLQGKLGNTDIHGQLNYLNVKRSVTENTGERALLEGDLSSKQVYLEDLMSLSTATEAVSKHSPEKNRKAKVDKTKSYSRLFPATPIPREALNLRDVHLSLIAGQLIKNGSPVLEDVKVTIKLDKGNLQLNPVQAMAHGGGGFKGQVTLNAAKSPMAAGVVMNIEQFPSAPLLARSGLSGMLSSPLSAHAELNGKGDSIAAILSNVTGPLNVHAGQGSISNKLDAKLGLDAGKMLWLSVRGDKPIGLNCGTMQFDFTKGIGTSRNIMLDTSQTYLQGNGTINLRDEKIDLVLIPRPKDPSLFSINSAIQVTGPINKPNVTLEKNAKTQADASGQTKTASGC